MNRLQRSVIVVAASLALAFCLVLPSFAQSARTERLEKQALALDQQVKALAQVGKYAEAIPLAQQMLTVLEKLLGPDHPLVATALSNLALLYYHEGRYAKAEPLFERALAIYEKALGPDHPLVASALNNLAGLYHQEGRYAKAEPLFKRALTIRETVLGPDDPHVATAMNNLGSLFAHEGRYAEAEPLYQRALAIDEKTLGPDHPSVAIDLNNLALLYVHEGRYTEAEPLLKRALAIREKALGPENPHVATALNNLALLYWDQGRSAEAEPLYKRALTIDEKALGPYHPGVAMDLNNLAALYDKEGRYAEAEPLFERALAIREKALGPDHPDVATALNNLALLYVHEGRYAQAEPLYHRALMIHEKALGPDHPGVAIDLNNLAGLYLQEGRYSKALPLIQMLIKRKAGFSLPALPVLFAAQGKNLISGTDAIDDSLNVVQRVEQTGAGKALNALAARFAAGSDRLAELVRKDQDLAGEAAALDKALSAALGLPPSPSNTSNEQQIRDRYAAIDTERDDLGKVLAREFPDYAALSNPQPLMVKDIQSLLADDEALVVFDLGIKSYVWAITHDAADWKELSVTADEVSKAVAALRGQLDFYNIKPFDPQPAFQLYQKVLAPVADVLKDKPRLSFVLNGALTSLPPQLLVTRDPTGKALKDVDWLIRDHSVTVLPSIESLKVLRGKSVLSSALEPLIGFADPMFNPNPVQLAQNTSVVSDVTAARGIHGTVANLAELEKALPPLPDTATELKEVALSVHADPVDVILGRAATVTRVKQEKLDQFRIVYFATHGLLAGDVAQFQKLNAEPALVLSLPAHPTQFDDGLLTASEVAQLKLNADWVVLSACNTAAGEKPGAEALSGLARAFFYAGARSLVVSNWEVDSKSAAQLMIGTFAALAADPKLSHAQALQQSMLAMVDNARHPEWADPRYWAPFIVVGEPQKPTR